VRRINWRTLAAAPTAARDTITFGTSRAGIRHSSVDVNVGLGQGANSLLFNYGSDLGHLAGPAGTPDAPGDFGPSTMNVNISDSGRRHDVDTVTLFANGDDATLRYLEPDGDNEKLTALRQGGQLQDVTLP
jgi:hypothetical protein